MEGYRGTIEAETDREGIAQVEDHANESWPDLELDHDTVENIRSKIRDGETAGRSIVSSAGSNRNGRHSRFSPDRPRR